MTNETKNIIVDRDNRKLSIITNFGCRFNCWYCIWRNHKFKKLKGPYDLKNIYEILQKYSKEPNNRILKISGGGDCLYNFNQNIEWWETIFHFCDMLNLKIHIHTREQLLDEFLLKNIHQMSLSSSYPLDVYEYIKILKDRFDFHNIRVYKVIESLTSENEIDEYIYLSEKLKIQITFRELVPSYYNGDVFTDNGNFDRLKKYYKHIKNIVFLEQNDYNMYLMPDGKLYENFII